jgi:hypothetical protein
MPDIGIIGAQHHSYLAKTLSNLNGKSQKSDQPKLIFHEENQFNIKERRNATSIS